MVLESLSWFATCPNHASFRFLTCCQKRFLWTLNKVDLAAHPVVGLVLQVGEAEKCPGFESLDPFFRVSKQGPCFSAVEEDGGDKRLVDRELTRKAVDFAPPDLV